MAPAPSKTPGHGVSDEPPQSAAPTLAVTAPGWGYVFPVRRGELLEARGCFPPEFSHQVLSLC